MRGNSGDQQRLLHILDAISTIQEFIIGVDYEAYQGDYKLRLAVVKLLEITGEAATHISEELRLKYPEVEWPLLRGMRNVFVHEYFGIDYEIMWKSLQQRLPQLKEKIEEIISKEFDD